MRRPKYLIRVACSEVDGTPVTYPCYLQPNGRTAAHGSWGKRNAIRFTYEAEAWDFLISSGHPIRSPEGEEWYWVELETATTCKGQNR